MEKLQVGQTLWLINPWNRSHEEIITAVIDKIGRKYVHATSQGYIEHRFEIDTMRSRHATFYLSEEKLREDRFELPALMNEIRRKTEYGTIPIEKARKIVEILNS